MRESLKVLLVEDDQPLAQMCAKLIRRRGHSVVTACSCHDAERIVAGVTDIDVVVSDIQMPEMSGIQLLARLRALNQSLPVILMTGCDAVPSPAEALEMGASAYIIKPFEPDAFVACIERARRSSPNLAAS